MPRHRWDRVAGLYTDAASKAFDWRLCMNGDHTIIYGREVLDLGTSPIDVLGMAWTAARYVAFDRDPLVLEACAYYAHPRTPLECVLGDVTDLPFPDAAFDTVLDLSTGDHVRDRQRMRREVRRVVRPGGHYVVTYPNRAFYDTDDTTEGVYEHRFLPEEMARELREAGFEIVLHEISGQRSGVIAE